MKSERENTAAVSIVVSMGDPFGIGPEICLKLLNERAWLERAGAAITVVGSYSAMESLAGSTGLVFNTDRVSEPVSGKGSVAIIDTGFPEGESAGFSGPSPEGGRACLSYIERSVSEVLCSRADAVVTCPISKKALSLAGSRYPGHTEMLGELAGAGGATPVMMMLSDRLKVAFVTTHLAFCDVSRILTVEKVVNTGAVFAEAMQKYFVKEPVKIALCALNPHAGDGGRFGREEEEILRPSVDRLREKGIEIYGPLPADSLFYSVLKGDYNGVVSLYHDQGMIPVKMKGPGEVVNITLGLPLIRTSPAHGTAYDIAGMGIADHTSLCRAVDTAAGMTRHVKTK